MKDRIEALRERLESDIGKAKTVAELRDLKAVYLGRTGEIPALMKHLGSLPKEERPEAGRQINEFKNLVLDLFGKYEKDLAIKELGQRYEKEITDISMPGKAKAVGAPHPVTLVVDELTEIFSGMGFVIYDGREIEDDYHNFTALNQPKDHPARDKQDSFYITDDILLRTHTSPGQIHMMETVRPPFKAVMPGRVFRCDDDATHAPMFHQIEGLVIDKALSLCDLHGLLDTLAKAVFTPDTSIRFRPSYFPFTEPSVEVDVSCFECGGKGCRLCKGTGWIEILGGGVVNGRVIANCGLDPDEWKGLAFGAGIERIAMLKYGINNIHVLYDGDVRILSQFH